MTENQTDKLDSSNLDAHHNGINFLELAILFIKNVKLILGVTLAGGVLSAGLSMLIPNTFTGVAKILPPQSNQSSSVNAVMLAQLGGLLE
ncbi:MAG: Wzz/FepE/Etk N-terminal domain-containing protein [Pseudomonadota bacterium]